VLSRQTESKHSQSLFLCQDRRRQGSLPEHTVGGNHREQVAADYVDLTSQGWSQGMSIKQEGSHLSSSVSSGRNKVSVVNQLRPGGPDRVMPSIQVTSVGVKRERKGSNGRDQEESKEGTKRRRR